MGTTVFVALDDVLRNEDAAKALHDVFDQVVVATRRATAVDELTSLADEVDAAIIGVRERIDGRALDRLGRLRVLGSMASGTDHIDLAALKARGVTLITAEGVNAPSVAEHSLMMMLALAKRALAGHAAVVSGADRSAMPTPPVQLSGRRVGILGAGSTGTALARLLSTFGCEMLAWTRRPAAHPEMAGFGARFCTLEELFSRCHVVSVHLPLTPETRGSITRELLLRLPFGAIVVNVARKEVFDLHGLVAASGQRDDILFGIDDFGLLRDGTVEALGARCLLSPHVAGVTEEALKAIQDRVVHGVVEYFR